MLLFPAFVVIIPFVELIQNSTNLGSSDYDIQFLTSFYAVNYCYVIVLT